MTALVFLMAACSAQTDDHEASGTQDIDSTPPMYYSIPDEIGSSDTTAGWTDDVQKIMLTGVVYGPDRRTPAPDVLLYYYHTDAGGRYTHRADIGRSLPPNSLGHTHGYLRGWVKTDEDGRYAIHTLRPGSYPSRDEAAHVHVDIKEPQLDEHYYIDDFVFDDDRLLTSVRRKRLKNRGGSGVMRLVTRGDVHIGERNIILGLNVPDHPSNEKSETSVGRGIGEDIISFTPRHAWGPDKGSKTCPICKYGWYHGILYFVGNDPDREEMRKWLLFLEAESMAREETLKAYLIYGSEEDHDPEAREKELGILGRELGLEKVALTYVPSFADTLSGIHLNGIDPAARNTFLIYKRSNVIDKYEDLAPTEENFKMISSRLDDTINEFFRLPRPKE